MLHVARITLDDAEWMILQFFFYTSVMLHVARITLDEAEWMILQLLHLRDVARRADHSGRRRMDDFTIFFTLAWCCASRGSLWTTQNVWFYNFYTCVMLHVARITLDDAEWTILQFFLH